MQMYKQTIFEKIKEITFYLVAEKKNKVLSHFFLIRCQQDKI